MISAGAQAAFDERIKGSTTADILNNFTVDALKKAFNIKNTATLRKADWVKLVGEAICNSCSSGCSDPSAGQLEKYMAKVANTMPFKDFKALVRTSLVNVAKSMDFMVKSQSLL